MIEKKQIFVNLCVFALCFSGALVMFGAYWVAKTFGTTDFAQIVFHLRFPLLDSNTPFVASFVAKVIMPSLALSFFIAFTARCVKFLRWFYEVIVLKFFYGFVLSQKAKVAKFAFALALCALFLNITNNKLKITRYFNTQETYSTLYEEHYKAFDMANLQDFSPKQNLIIILAESLESTFSAKNIPYSQGGGGGFSPFGELIPNLTNLALKNTNFSSTNALGGITQTFGTGWTIAGTIGHLCAVPLNMPIDGNAFNNKHFLSSATCVSDILKDLGYTQIYFSGLDAQFAGTKFLFEAHGVEVRDLAYFQKQNLLPKKLPKNLQGYWGLKDAKVFEFAKDYVNSANEPFALYISTIDTHAHKGFVDKERCEMTDDYQGAITCADKIISDFVNFVAQSKFKDSTTIIILGDHLSMTQNFFPPQTNRAIYNAFINAKFTQKPTKERTKNRILSHFDIAPLILNSVGIEVREFGLGRNPLYEQTLLESDFTLDDFNKALSQRSKMYDSFWEIK